MVRTDTKRRHGGRRTRFARVCLLVPMILAGCAEHWARPGGTPAQRDAALARCDAESHARFPPILQQVLVRPGYFAPPQRHCRTVNNQTYCDTTGGYWVPPMYQTVDHNAEARRASRLDCMYSLGWMMAKDAKEAEAVTKSAPFPPSPPPQPPRGAP